MSVWKIASWSRTFKVCSWPVKRAMFTQPWISQRRAVFRLRLLSPAHWMFANLQSKKNRLHPTGKDQQFLLWSSKWCCDFFPKCGNFSRHWRSFVSTNFCICFCGASNGSRPAWVNGFRHQTWVIRLKLTCPAAPIRRRMRWTTAACPKLWKTVRYSADM